MADVRSQWECGTTTTVRTSAAAAAAAAALRAPAAFTRQSTSQRASRHGGHGGHPVPLLRRMGDGAAASAGGTDVERSGYPTMRGRVLETRHGQESCRLFPSPHFGYPLKRDTCVFLRPVPFPAVPAPSCVPAPCIQRPFQSSRPPTASAVRAKNLVMTSSFVTPNPSTHLHQKAVSIALDVKRPTPFRIP